MLTPDAASAAPEIVPGDVEVDGGRLSSGEVLPTAPAPDLVAVVLDHGGTIARVSEAEADRLVAAGEGRRANARDLAIAGQA